MGVKTCHVLGSDGVSHHGWMVQCPACGSPHCFDGRWTFNGDHERPDCTHAMKGQKVPAPDWERTSP